MPPTPPAQQIVVPVLGMHRSGTSLTARLLNLLGMELGEPLQPPGPDNPKGFWENRLFQNLNMQMLERLGFNRDGFGTEKDLYRAFGALELTDIGPDTMRVIETSLREQFTGPCWGFKDPRTVLNYPCWERILEELGYTQVRPIVVLRRPEACAQSLLRRGNVAQIPRQIGQSPSRTALDMWRAYTRILLHHLDLDACLVICQEDLLNSERVEGELRRMAAWIGIPDADLSDALAWIEPGLDHRKPLEGDQLDPELRSLDRLIRELAAAQRARSLDTELPPAPPAMEHPPERCIYIVSPTRYGHSEAFSEIALALHHGMARLDIEAPIVRDSWDIRGTPVVLGPHLLLDYPQRNPLPEDAILYNLEQVDPHSDHFPPVYLELLRRYRIWDYSPRNIEQLADMGVPDVRLCQIGFVPELVRIPQRAHQDVDVLFYGSLNPRRRRILNQLNDRGLKVMVLQGIYGVERDAWIARSKIVINIHYFEAKVLEVVRLSYLLSNGRFVISERGKDTDLEAPYTQGLVLDHYEMLVPQVLTWIQNPSARQAVAAEGQRLFSQRDQAAWLRPLLCE